MSEAIYDFITVRGGPKALLPLSTSAAKDTTLLCSSARNFRASMLVNRCGRSATVGSNSVGQQAVNVPVNDQVM